LFAVSPCKNRPEFQNEKNLKLQEINTQLIKSRAHKFSNNRQTINKTLSGDELPK
jgi:hypothetical protein